MHHKYRWYVLLLWFIVWQYFMYSSLMDGVCYLSKDFLSSSSSGSGSIFFSPSDPDPNSTQLKSNKKFASFVLNNTHRIFFLPSWQELWYIYEKIIPSVRCGSGLRLTGSGSDTPEKLDPLPFWHVGKPDPDSDRPHFTLSILINKNWWKKTF